MKKMLSAAFVVVFLAGCSSISGTRQLTDGSVLTVRANRFLWASEGIDASTKDQQGFEFSLKVQKSNPDIEAIKAVAEGAANGAAKAVIK